MTRRAASATRHRREQGQFTRFADFGVERHEALVECRAQAAPLRKGGVMAFAAAESVSSSALMVVPGAGRAMLSSLLPMRSRTQAK